MASATQRGFATTHPGPNNLTGWLTRSEPGSDTTHGQIMLVAARWVLIVVGTILTLQNPNSLIDLQVSIVGLLAIAGLNFLLHTNLIMKRPASEPTLYLASCGDIVLISAIVAISGGFDSYAFVFYYPAIIAYSLVFSLRTTAYFTGSVLALYTFVVVMVSGEALSADLQGTAATVAARLVTFVAVMTVSNMYRFIERRRPEQEVSRVAARPRSRSARASLNSTSA